MNLMHPEVKQLISQYQLEPLPVEGTLFAQTYRSALNENQRPHGTAIIGLYTFEPFSVSCFHRLDQDEIWHFYKGDPFQLYLLYPDGTTAIVELGKEVFQGQKVQYIVPAGVWQGGCLKEGGRYALFGCTMAPGFIEAGFEAGLATELTAQYPEMKDIINFLNVNGAETKMK